MAVYHGKSASVKKNAVAIAEITGWTIESSVDFVEANDFGDTWKKSEAGMIGWTGSMEGNVDPANTEQMALLNAILTGPTKLTDVKFYIDATKNLSGNIWIENFSIVASIGDLVKVSFTIRGDDTLAYSAT